MTTAWHHVGKPNLLGCFTIFCGHGEGPHNQVGSVPTLEDANLVCAVHDLLAALKRLRKATDPIWPYGLLDVEPWKELELARIAADLAIKKAEGRSMLE